MNSVDFHPEYAGIIGQAICYDLKNVVEKIEIVGGIRRKLDRVLGVSIIYISKAETEKEEVIQGDLFRDYKPKRAKKMTYIAEKAISNLYYLKYLDQEPSSRLETKKMYNPPTGVPVDLFPVDSFMEWGIALTLKTGPARFAAKMIEAAKQNGYRCDGHRLFRMNDNSWTPVSTEEEFFKICDIQWIEPEKR